MVLVLLLFFFSSRRRHTRYIGDWSSDVCSSDLRELQHVGARTEDELGQLLSKSGRRHAEARARQSRILDLLGALSEGRLRSEERRVGKECRYRWSPDPSRKKT